MGFKILEHLGCDPIIIIGQDCSVPNLEKTHASGTHNIAVTNMQKTLPGNLYKIKGNFEEWVYTVHYLDLFRKIFVSDVSKYHGICINSTEGGAYIEGTTLLPLKEALAKYCQKPFQPREILKECLTFPTEDQMRVDFTRFCEILKETQHELSGALAFCEKMEKEILEFESQLAQEGFSNVDRFLAEYPEDQFEEKYQYFSQSRLVLNSWGKYFNNYAMQFVQMNILQFEMKHNELLSLIPNPKLCKLKTISMLRTFFPTIRNLLKIGLEPIIKAQETFPIELKSIGENGKIHNTGKNSRK